jgi:hypothetical protein
VGHKASMLRIRTIVWEAVWEEVLLEDRVENLEGRRWRGPCSGGHAARRQAHEPDTVRISEFAGRYCGR